MISLAGTILAESTLIKLVVGALVAGLGVTVAFSLLIYCAERAVAFRRDERTAAAVAFQAASVVVALIVVGIIAYGFVLMVSKPK